MNRALRIVWTRPGVVEEYLQMTSGVAKTTIWVVQSQTLSRPELPERANLIMVSGCTRGTDRVSPFGQRLLYNQPVRCLAIRGGTLTV